MPVFMTTPHLRRPECVMPDDYVWLGRTIALLDLWNSPKAIFARVAAQGLDPSPSFQSNVGTIQLAVHEAVANLRLRVRQRPSGAVFAPNTPSTSSRRSRT